MKKIGSSGIIIASLLSTKKKPPNDFHSSGGFPLPSSAL
nr:MAG TPA: hypothetical protein [Inoviridae sp.]